MRRKLKQKNIVVADRKYDSVRVSKLINYIMLDGKKEVANKVVYGAFNVIKEKTGGDPLEVFETALKNAGPHTEVRSRRVGGANYQVPREVKPERRLQLALRWLTAAARSKSGTDMSTRLANELMQAAEGEGPVVKKKEDTHRMAEANKAFAHFSW